MGKAVTHKSIPKKQPKNLKQAKMYQINMLTTSKVAQKTGSWEKKDEQYIPHKHDKDNKWMPKKYQVVAL